MAVAVAVADATVVAAQLPFLFPLTGSIYSRFYSSLAYVCSKTNLMVRNACFFFISQKNKAKKKKGRQPTSSPMNSKRTEMKKKEKN